MIRVRVKARLLGAPFTLTLPRPIIQEETANGFDPFAAWQAYFAQINGALTAIRSASPRTVQTLCRSTVSRTLGPF